VRSKKKKQLSSMDLDLRKLSISNIKGMKSEAGLNSRIKQKKLAR
jgi:hypothetical protein